MKLVVTGSNGLIGSEVVRHFDQSGWEIHGADNNMRAQFFGPQGDTRWQQQQLISGCSKFTHHELDIRDRAAQIPYDDFDVNAVGTLNLLEAVRQTVPEAPFVHMSTNKVYGDAPNELPLVELDTRWEFANQKDYNGIDESMRIDHSKHSLFGASKVAADIMVQEYGRYFQMKTCCLRGGCLTGPNHSGVELHGFLSYLVKVNMTGDTYTVFGYKGKQVRDNIHSYDVARFIEAFINRPGEAKVYNLGGGRDNACSILEAFEKISALSGKPMNYQYSDKAREGDHQCYISDLTNIRADYPEWGITKSLDQIFEEIYLSWKDRIHDFAN